MAALHPRPSEGDVTGAQPFDVAIIGGGVVGISIARQLSLCLSASDPAAAGGGNGQRSLRTVLLEASPHLLSGASGNNSGIACTGVDATEGTLERALIRDAISRIRPFCRRHNVPMRECGSLVCLWPWDGEEEEGASADGGTKLEDIARESWDAGDCNAKVLSPEEVATLEPNLVGSRCRGAVHIPGEIVLDPWLLPMAMLVQARERGCKVFTDYQCDAGRMNYEEGVWTLPRVCADAGNSSSARGEGAVTSDLTLPDAVRARVVINAAGLLSDLVQELASPLVPSPRFSALPRRGQYRIYSAASDTRIDHPIQPVPTQFTKGVFVFSTLYGDLVVGPTAEDQESRTDATPREEVAAMLDDHGRRILPGIDPVRDLKGEYVGIRPGTDHRDYQIRAFPKHAWLTVGGIRSTGLTASLGISRHVVQTLLPTVLQSETISLVGEEECDPVPLPPLEGMIEEFNSRGDSCVTIRSRLYKVTHPLTRAGWRREEGS